MSKKLDENGIVNELKGSSVFFRQEEELSPHEESPSLPTNVSPSQGTATRLRSDLKEAVRPSITATSEPSNSIAPHESTQAISNASMHARKVENVIDEIRKTVKTIGKSELYVRITSEEKDRLVDIVYTYKRQGVKTSENEVSRIALNYLITDYQANGQASILAQVIEALLA